MGTREQLASPSLFVGASVNASTTQTYASVLSASSRDDVPTSTFGRGGGGKTGLNTNAPVFKPAGSHSGTTGERGKSNSKSNKKKKSQARQDRWRQQAHMMELKKKYRHFNKGVHKFKSKLHNTHEELSASLVRGKQDNDRDGLFGAADVKFAGLHGTDCGNGVDGREMKHMLEFLEDGGVGYIAETKRRGMIRIMFENWNSLGLFTNTWKVDRLNYLIKSLSIDIIGGCESQVDWSFVKDDMQFLNLFRRGRAVKGAYSHNTDPDSRILREQMGGTGLAALGRLCDNVDSTGVDPTGLGRWSWIKLGSGSTTTFLICAYTAGKPDLRKSKGKTRWEQEQWYFVRKGDLRDPAEIFLQDILSFIRQCRLSGAQVMLALDANQHVYDGQLANALKDAPFHMGCLMEEAMGSKVPNSHFRGTDPITTIFGTPGLRVGEGMVYPHWYGVGDHQVFVLEVSPESLFGGDSHPIPPASMRSLNCKISRARRQYCKVLKSLTDRHKMHDKLQKLNAISDDVTVAQYQLMHNKWDNELGNFMASAESQCNKMKSCSIEYSPTVGIVIKQRAILKWILRWQFPPSIT